MTKLTLKAQEALKERLAEASKVPFDEVRIVRTGGLFFTVQLLHKGEAVWQIEEIEIPVSGAITFGKFVGYVPIDTKLS